MFPRAVFFPLLIMGVCFTSVPTSDSRPCHSLYTHIYTYNPVAPYHNALLPYLYQFLVGEPCFQMLSPFGSTRAGGYLQNRHNIVT